MTNAFDQFAKYYDVLYGQNVYGENAGEIDFYLAAAQKYKGKVLELGCGTGRVYLDLLREGIDILGIDNSESMLAILNEKSELYNCEPKTQIGDMVTYSQANTYDLIIIPLNSVHHLFEKEQQTQLFLNIYKNLKPGGSLLFSTQIYSKDFKDLTEFTYAESYNHDGWGIELDLYLMFNTEKNALHERFVVTDENADEKETTYDLGLLYCYTNEEIKSLLNFAGFKKITTFGDFKRSPFKANKHDQVVWEAQKT